MTDIRTSGLNPGVQIPLSSRPQGYSVPQPAPGRPALPPLEYRGKTQPAYNPNAAPQQHNTRAQYPRSNGTAAAATVPSLQQQYKAPQPSQHQVPQQQSPSPYANINNAAVTPSTIQQQQQQNPRLSSVSGNPTASSNPQADSRRSSRLSSSEISSYPNGTTSTSPDLLPGYRRSTGSVTNVSLTSDRSSTAALNPDLDDDDVQRSTLGKVLHLLDMEYSLMNSFPASLNVWISFWMLPFSLVFFISAFSTVGWAEVDSNFPGFNPVNRRLGLWQMCHNISGCGIISSSDVGGSGGFKAAQVFSVFSLLALFAAVVAFACYIFFPRFHKTIKYGYIALASRLATVVLLLLTFAVFADNWYRPAFIGADYVCSLRYSHALCIVAWVTEIISLIFIALEVYNKQHESLHLTSLKELEKLASNQASADTDAPSQRSVHGQGREEMPDKASHGNGWEEMPDKSPRGNGWEEMPDRSPSVQSAPPRGQGQTETTPPPPQPHQPALRQQGRRSVKKKAEAASTYEMPEPQLNPRNSSSVNTDYTNLAFHSPQPRTPVYANTPTDTRYQNNPTYSMPEPRPQPLPQPQSFSSGSRGYQTGMDV